MKSLSITSLPAFPLRDKLTSLWRQLRQRRKAPVLAATDPLAAAPDEPGLRFRLGGSRYLFVDRVCIYAVLTAIALYVVAAFLANEWLYLLSVGSLFCAILSIVYPMLIIASVEADGSLPEYGAAAEGALINIQVRQKRLLGPLNALLPISSMRVRAVLARRTIGGYEADSIAAQNAVNIGDVGSSANLTLNIPLLGRGVYKLSHIDVATCMPFGFAWAIGRVSITEDTTKPNALVVMPQITDLRGDFLENLTGIYSPVGLNFANVRAFTQSSSSRGLREFRTGDSLRHIHWPSSAKMNKLLVREFDSETLPVFNLYLDLEAKWIDRKQFELAVQLIYSLIQFGNDHDMLPQLFLSPAINSKDLLELMSDLPQLKPPMEMLSEILARVEPLPYSGSRAKPPIDTRYQVLTIVPSKDSVLIAGGKASPIHLMVAEADAPSSGTMIGTVYTELDLQAL